AVLLAGHSCPAVSSAYQLTKKALKALYREETPIRGEVRVLVKGGPRDLAYGPQAQVISFITGSWGETGFKGLGGKFSRNDKLLFDTEDVQFNTFIFQRIDNKKAVQISCNPGVLPQDPRMSSLMPLMLQNKASDEEKELFQSIWQGNVRKILLEDEAYPGLFTLKELPDFQFPVGQ
ncbi:MAG: FmdE family protein, partial [Thermodesulfobacteriota bacterium]